MREVIERRDREGCLRANGWRGVLFKGCGEQIDTRMEVYIWV